MDLRHPLWRLCLLCLLLGIACDFLFNGVGKIIWMVIYIPSYFAFAMTLGNQLHRGRLAKYANYGVTAFLLGTAGGHWLLNGVHRRTSFSMNLQSQVPIVLSSQNFPERLFVTSKALSEYLAKNPAARDGLRVTSDEVLDYGCIKSFVVSAVAGIEIQEDPEARWTLRTYRGDPPSTSMSPAHEDRILPWCQLQFYGSRKDPLIPSN